MTRDTCYYDGHCGLCRRTTRVLHAADVLGRLRFTDMLSVPESTLPVPLAAAMTGMPMRTRRGRVLLGFPAVRRAAAQTLLAPLAWLLYLPGLGHLGAATYRHIAANRSRQCDMPGASPARMPRP